MAAFGASGREADPERRAGAALHRELAAQLAREAGKGDVAGNVAVVRDTVERWLAREGSEAELQAFVEKVLARSGPRTARDVLSRLGVLEVFSKHARELGRAQLQGLFASDPFEKWAQELFAG